MKFLIQRVTRASVHVGGNLEARIGKGLLVLVGIGAADTAKDAEYLAGKLVNLRMFSDEAGKMNLSALDVGAELLLVSQFTLYGDCRKGRRPGFDAAALPGPAKEMFEYAVLKVRDQCLTTLTGVFQAHMEVELVNDGPVTFLIES